MCSLFLSCILNFHSLGQCDHRSGAEGEGGRRTQAKGRRNGGTYSTAPVYRSWHQPPVCSWSSLLPRTVTWRGLHLHLAGKGTSFSKVKKYLSTCVFFPNVVHWNTDWVRTGLSKKFVDVLWGLCIPLGHSHYCQGNWPQVSQWRKKKKPKDSFENIIFISNLLWGCS